MGDNIKIGLTNHPINNGNKLVKRDLGQINSRTKGVHVELVIEPMKGESDLITKVMK